MATYTTKNYLENNAVEIDGIYAEVLVNEYGSEYGMVYHIVGGEDAATRILYDLQMGNPSPYGTDVWNQIRYEIHPSGTPMQESWQRIV